MSKLRTFWTYHKNFPWMDEEEFSRMVDTRIDFLYNAHAFWGPSVAYRNRRKKLNILKRRRQRRERRQRA